MPKEPIRAPLGVNVPGLTMAGFQLTLHGRFWVIPEDKTELCWTLQTAHVVLEADLADWKTGDFKQLALYAKNEIGWPE